MNRKLNNVKKVDVENIPIKLKFKRKDGKNVYFNATKTIKKRKKYKVICVYGSLEDGDFVLENAHEDKKNCDECKKRAFYIKVVGKDE